MNHKKKALYKFIKTDKNKSKNIGNCSLNEQVNNIKIDENENREEVLVNEQVNNVVMDENEDNKEVLLVNEQEYIISYLKMKKKKKLIN